MTRTVKEEEYAAKRNEILDAAQHLVFTKGYERMSIQDILDRLGISKGAFYHYFDSKAALLEAYIERGQDDLDKQFHAIIDDPSLSAIEKLRRFFATLDRARLSQQVFIADLIQVWFADENAIVREKIDAVIVERRAALLNAIVHQGIREGVFTTPYPDQAGPIILSITRGMANVLIKLILAFGQAPDDAHIIDDVVASIVTTCAAMAEAIERVLGTSAPILDRPGAQAIQGWLATLSSEKARTASAAR